MKKLINNIFKQLLIKLLKRQQKIWDKELYMACFDTYIVILTEEQEKVAQKKKKVLPKYIDFIEQLIEKLNN